MFSTVITELGIEILFNSRHDDRAELQITSTVLGTEISPFAEGYDTSALPSFVSIIPSIDLYFELPVSIAILSRRGHPAKEDPSIEVVEAGIVILVRLSHFEKDITPILFSV